LKTCGTSDHAALSTQVIFRFSLS